MRCWKWWINGRISRYIAQMRELAHKLPIGGEYQLKRLYRQYPLVIGEGVTGIPAYKCGNRITALSGGKRLVPHAGRGDIPLSVQSGSPFQGPPQPFP